MKDGFYFKPFMIKNGRVIEIPNTISLNELSSLLVDVISYSAV